MRIKKIVFFRISKYLICGYVHIYIANLFTSEK